MEASIEQDAVLPAIVETVGGALKLPYAAIELAGDAAALRRSGRGPPFPELTEREREMLALVSQGLTNTAVADRLHLSHKTVRNYVSSIFTKLGVAHRGEAVARAREAGLGA